MKLDELLKSIQESGEALGFQEVQVALRSGKLSTIRIGHIVDKGYVLIAQVPLGYPIEDGLTDEKQFDEALAECQHALVLGKEGKPYEPLYAQAKGVETPVNVKRKRGKKKPVAKSTVVVDQ